MGTWGQTPFDSDTFADLFSDVESDLAERVEVAVRSQLFKVEGNRVDVDGTDKWAVVGIVIWACECGVWLHHEKDEVIDRAVALIDELEDDDEWLDSWRGGTNINKYLDVAREILSDIRGGHEHAVLPHQLSELFPKQGRPARRRRIT